MRPEKYALQKELRPAALRGEAIVALRARPCSRLRLESSHLLVLSQASRLLMFDGLSYQPVRSFGGVQCATKRIDVAFSPDGGLVAAGSEGGGLCLWDAETGAPRWQHFLGPVIIGAPSCASSENGFAGACPAGEARTFERVCRWKNEAFLLQPLHQCADNRFAPIGPLRSSCGEIERERYIPSPKRV
jgi:hypothetical protein